MSSIPNAKLASITPIGMILFTNDPKNGREQTTGQQKTIEQLVWRDNCLQTTSCRLLSRTAVVFVAWTNYSINLVW
jgi:hypothetical protein